MNTMLERINPKELTGNQRTAYKNCKHAANFIIGGLENGLYDEIEGSEEYNAYKAKLDNHEHLVDQIEFEAMSGEYGPGFSGCNPIKEMRFAGKEFIRRCVEQLVTDMGY